MIVFAPKNEHFLAYFPSKIWNDPSKSAPNQNFPFSTQTNYVNLNVLKFSLRA